MSIKVTPFFPVFTDIDGQPLENGKIYVGLPNVPTVSNQIQVYWDEALTMPASQPITTLGGYPSNNGTPAAFYVDRNYSLLVQNKLGTQVYSAPESSVDSEPVNVKEYGARGDDVTDDTAAIQAAIDANDNVYFPEGRYIITSPIYLPQFKTIRGDGHNSVIIKQGTTVGTGSNTMRGGTVTDSYAVNAVLIYTHTDSQFNYRSCIYDMRIQGDDDFSTTYGIYAPRLSQCVFQNVSIFRCNTGFAAYDAWNNSFDRVTVDCYKIGTDLAAELGVPVEGTTNFTRGFHWIKDGSGLGTGTSNTWNVCYARRADRGWQLSDLSYSNLISCGADQIGECPYRFETCFITMDGCATEQSIMNPGIECAAGEYTITGFQTYEIYGASLSAVYEARSAATITFDSCRFQDYTAVNSAYNQVIQEGSKVYQRATRIPTNGSDFISFSSGSELQITDTDDVIFRDADKILSAKQRINTIGGQLFKRAFSVVSAGVDLFEVSVDGLGGNDFAAGKIKIQYYDTTFPDGTGYLETAFTVYQNAGSYYQNVNDGASSICGNSFVNHPAWSQTRVGDVWTFKLTPAYGDISVVFMEIDWYTDTNGGATATLL